MGGYVKRIYDLMVNSWATLLVGLVVPITAAMYGALASLAAYLAVTVFRYSQIRDVEPAYALPRD